MKLRIAAAIALASTLFLAGSASAQAADEPASRPMGVRLETALALDDFNLVNLGGGDDQSDMSPHGDIRIGYDLDNGLTPLIGLGYRAQSRTVTVGDDETENSLSALVLAVELRYYLSKHRRGLQPFVWGEFNTSFVSVDFEANDDDANEEQADEYDHTALNLGIGAEYKFTRSFAVGGKWGLGFGFKPSETGEGDAKEEVSDTTWGTSSSVYLAWRL